MANNVTVDLSAMESLNRDILEMRKIAIGRLAERGYQLLREEIRTTAYVTGNLLQGVAPPQIETNRATLTVSARSAKRGARTGTLYYGDGNSKKITLQATEAFNYAETVARGRPAMRAKSAGALLIPVNAPPNGKNYTYKDGKYTVSAEPYIKVDGQFYIMRKSAKAVPANPYDERAAKRLLAESVKIIDGVIADFS